MAIAIKHRTRTWTINPNPDQILQGKMVLANYFSWNFGLPNHFFRHTKISVTVQPRSEHGAGQKCPHGKIFEEFSVAIYVVVWIVASLKL